MDRILRPGGLSVRFQPIVEWHEDGFRWRGVEGLVSGPPGSTVESAEVLFDYVRRKREEVAVDRACTALVIEAAQYLPKSLQVSVNVHAATLSSDPGFLAHLLRHLEAHRIEPSRVTVEIVEHTREWAGPVLLTVLQAMRDRGFRLALDDVGQGQSNYRMIVDCKPDYLKVDSYFVRGVQDDPYRQAVLHSVAVLASRLGGSVVVEGVEQRAELDTAMSLGVSLFQGYLFSPPVGSRELIEKGPTGWANPGVAAVGSGRGPMDEVCGCTRGTTT
jgi:EAL domain-containing protein (putative c-di-GMP-specific phosphodiesterase class I)